MMTTLSPVHFAAKKNKTDTLSGKEWSGSFSRAPRGTQVIKTAQDWKNLWQNTIGSEAPKGFNPDKQIAVFIGIGGRSSGGYNIKVTSAAENGNQFVISYVEQRPQGAAIAVMTNPFLVKVFPKTDKEVSIIERNAAV